MRIQNNISALNALNNVTKNENKLTANIKKLSSGYKINSAADDAAGLAISEKMRSQIRGLGKAIQNANDGISATETAEGAMQEVTNILQRMRELSVQAANTGTYNSDQIGNLQSEFDQLKKEIDRIATSSKYNGTTIGNGDGKFSFMVDANGKTDMAIKLTIESFKADALGITGDTANVGAKSIAGLDEALDKVTKARADIGAVTNRLEYTVSNLTTMKENITQAESRIRDVDMSAEYVEMTKNSVLNQASVAMLSQANSTTQNVLSLIQ